MTDYHSDESNSLKDSNPQSFTSYGGINPGGRKAKRVLKTETCLQLNPGLVELKGIILRRVSTAIIEHKVMAYFKCRNMKTPTKNTGVCNFSGRIPNYPDYLEMEIISDHSPHCSFVNAPKNGNGVLDYHMGEDLNLNENENQPEFTKSSKRKRPRNRNNKQLKKERDDVSIHSEDGTVTEIYIQLSNKEDEIKMKRNERKKLIYGEIVSNIAI
jgi:hypothetical protein